MGDAQGEVRPEAAGIDDVSQALDEWVWVADTGKDTLLLWNITNQTHLISIDSFG